MTAAAAASAETLRALPAHGLHERLRAGALCLRIGPFAVRYRGDDPVLTHTLHEHFPDYPLADPDGFADAAIRLQPRSRWRRRERVLCLEDEMPFTRFPESALLAHLEWSLNWCVATRANWFLMLHGAVVARDDRAIVFPGAPGAGKSTLCAYLALNGWRLMSDEFTLLADDARSVQAFPRLIPLKNESIGLIRELAPQARFGPSIEGTHKGTVAHLMPERRHIEQMDRLATVQAIVFPSYQAGAAPSVTPIVRPELFSMLTDHAFNYRLRGASAFAVLADLAELPAWRLVYSELRDAARIAEELLQPL